MTSAIKAIDTGDCRRRNGGVVGVNCSSSDKPAKPANVTQPKMATMSGDDGGAAAGRLSWRGRLCSYSMIFVVSHLRKKDSAAFSHHFAYSAVDVRRLVIW